jgi:hypothetical protein
LRVDRVNGHLNWYRADFRNARKSENLIRNLHSQPKGKTKDGRAPGTVDLVLEEVS